MADYATLQAELDQKIAEHEANPRVRIRRRKGLSKGRRKLARRHEYYAAYSHASAKHNGIVAAPPDCDCEDTRRRNVLIANLDLCGRCGGCWGIERRCKAACACYGDGKAAAEFVQEAESDRRWGFWIGGLDSRPRAPSRCFMCGAGSVRTLPFLGGRYNSLAEYERAGAKERLCIDLQACKRRENAAATPYKLLARVKDLRRRRYLRGLPPNDNFNFADAFGESSDRKMEELDKALARCKANPQTRQTHWVIKPAWNEFDPYSLYLCADCPLKPPEGKCPLAAAERQARLEDAEPVRGGGGWRGGYEQSGAESVQYKCADCGYWFPHDFSTQMYPSGVIVCIPCGTARVKV